MRIRDWSSDVCSADRQARALPGITLSNGVPDGSGLVVTSMETDGQASRLGIRVGDGVVSLDGMPIRSLDQASAYLLRHDRRSEERRVGEECGRQVRSPLVPEHLQKKKKL